MERSFRLQRPGRHELNQSVDRSTPESWEKLLAAAQRGDGDSYRRFLLAVLPFARTVARTRLRSNELVEDAVQDALLTIHRVRHTYQPGLAVRPWLAAIVSRRAIDIGRRRGRIESREQFDPQAYETFVDPESKQLGSGDEARTVGQMMSELTPKQKEALELVKLREMSLAEASVASGQSIASLKVNIHRAIRKLRAQFGSGAAR